MAGKMAASYISNYKSGQITATTTAQALPAQGDSELVVQNDPASTVNVLIGGVDNQYIALLPGGSWSGTPSNTGLIYVKTSSGTATVNYMLGS